MLRQRAPRRSTVVSREFAERIVNGDSLDLLAMLHIFCIEPALHLAAVSLASYFGGEDVMAGLICASGWNRQTPPLMPIPSAKIFPS